LQAHCQSRTNQPARQSFVKELANATLDKNVLKIFLRLKKIKTPRTSRQFTIQRLKQTYSKQQPTSNGRQKASLQQRFCKSGGAVLRVTVFSYNWRWFFKRQVVRKSPAFAKPPNVACKHNETNRIKNIDLFNLDIYTCK